MAFSYKDYLESEAVKNARKELDNNSVYKESNDVVNARNNLNSLKAPEPYTSQYQDKARSTLSKLENRKPFSYDLNGDMLYQQYKDKYMQQGQLAMMNTMGQASALTGGYGNSYAQTVGNQAYQQSLQSLNDIIPTLYQLALDKYRGDTSDLKDMYGIYSNAEQMDYGRYRDKLADYQTDRAYLTDVYNNASNMDYSRFSDNRSYLANQYDNERNADYSKYSDAYSRAFANYQQGVSEQQWQKQFDETVRANKANEAISRSRASSGGSGGSSGTSAKSINQKNVNAIMNNIADESTFKANAKAITRGNRGNTGNGGYSYNGTTYSNYGNYVKSELDKAYSSGIINDTELELLINQYYNVLK